MPTYAIHHFSALAVKQAPSPRGARRIAMRARKAAVADRRTTRRAA